MTDDLKDIDPEIVQKVLEHADEFVAIHERVDGIISWGEAELRTRERAIFESSGTIEDFKTAAREIEAQVAQKLKAFEEELAAKYPAPPGTASA